MSIKRHIAYIATIIVLPVFMAITSCGHAQESVNLTMNQGQGNCAVTNESNATIRCDGGVLTFEGLAVTPDPCYFLKSNLDFTDDSNLVIDITSASALAAGGYCTECLGKISFNGTVTMSGVCSRTFSIIYNGDTIAIYER